MAGRKKKQRLFTEGPICFRKTPYVSERTYMFQKNPICLKKRPICCPYVVLSEEFSSPYVEKAPYVANQVPICGPYAAHMWPICFGCSSDSILPFRLHAHTLCQLWYNIRTNVSTKFTDQFCHQQIERENVLSTSTNRVERTPSLQ